MARQLDPNTPVTCRNPATGQIIPTTIKVFHSIYVDKGFELVTRDNADRDPTDPGRATTRRRSEPASEIGSAASIAKGLGLGNKGDGNSMTVKEAGDKSKGRVSGEPKTPADNADEGVDDDGNEANTNGATVTAERGSVGRDRGGNS